MEGKIEVKEINVKNEGCVGVGEKRAARNKRNGIRMTQYVHGNK